MVAMTTIAIVREFFMCTQQYWYNSSICRLLKVSFKIKIHVLLIFFHSDKRKLISTISNHLENFYKRYAFLVICQLHIPACICVYLTIQLTLEKSKYIIDLKNLIGKYRLKCIVYIYIFNTDINIRRFRHSKFIRTCALYFCSRSML